MDHVVIFISFKYQRRFCATHHLIGKAKQNMIQQSASLRGSAGIRTLRKELSEEIMTPLKGLTSFGCYQVVTPNNFHIIFKHFEF